MSNNPEAEIKAEQEGREYFEDYDTKNKHKYKHSICSLNTIYWWHRDKPYKKFIITNKIISFKYFENLIPSDPKLTKNLWIYYYEIDSNLNINDLNKKYEKFDVHFIRLNSKPSNFIRYYTKSGKFIGWNTLGLFSNNIVAFDIKNLGLIRDINGNNQRIYRIKDKSIFANLNEKFETFLSNQKI